MPRGSKPRVVVRPRGVTDRQEEYLDALRRLTAALQRGPSASEVSRHIIPHVSRQGALKQLNALEAKGLVRVQLERGRPPLWLAVEA